MLKHCPKWPISWVHWCTRVLNHDHSLHHESWMVEAVFFSLFIHGSVTWRGFPMLAMKSLGPMWPGVDCWYGCWEAECSGWQAGHGWFFLVQKSMCGTWIIPFIWSYLYPKWSSKYPPHKGWGYWWWFIAPIHRAGIEQLTFERYTLWFPWNCGSLVKFLFCVVKPLNPRFCC